MGKKWTADRRLYLDATREKVIECKQDGSPGDGAAFLLCIPGREVPAATVERYKLKNKTKPKAKAKAPAEDKAKKPAANKAAK